MPAFSVPSGIRGEQNAVLNERGFELTEYSGKLLSRHVEKRSISKNTIEGTRREAEREKVLMPCLAAAQFFRHFAKGRAAIESDGVVPKRLKVHEIAARSAAQIQYSEPLTRGQIPQQRLVVLSDIVVLGSLPEGARARFVMIESLRGDIFQIVGRELFFHGR